MFPRRPYFWIAPDVQSKMWNLAHGKITTQTIFFPQRRFLKIHTLSGGTQTHIESPSVRVDSPQGVSSKFGDRGRLETDGPWADDVHLLQRSLVLACHDLQLHFSRRHRGRGKGCVHRPGGERFGKHPACGMYCGRDNTQPNGEVGKSIGTKGGGRTATPLPGSFQPGRAAAGGWSPPGCRPPGCLPRPTGGDHPGGPRGPRTLPP